jgi:hypothetical protein
MDVWESSLARMKNWRRIRVKRRFTGVLIKGFVTRNTFL